MKKIIAVLFSLFLAVLPAYTQQGCHISADLGRITNPGPEQLTCVRDNASTIGWAPSGESTWSKYTITKVANGVQGCATATGCWSVNNGLSQVAAVATTQNISLSSNIISPFVDFIRMKTATACTGTSTLVVTGFGVVAESTRFVGSLTYDLKAAVSTSNISFPTIAANAPTTTGAHVFVMGVTSSGTNISTVAAGCSVDVHIRWSSLR